MKMTGLYMRTMCNNPKYGNACFDLHHISTDNCYYSILAVSQTSPQSPYPSSILKPIHVSTLDRRMSGKTKNQATTSTHPKHKLSVILEETGKDRKHHRQHKTRHIVVLQLWKIHTCRSLPVLHQRYTKGALGLQSNFSPMILSPT